MIEAIKIVKSEWLDDWYTIERASHANVHGIERRDGGVESELEPRPFTDRLKP